MAESIQHQTIIVQREGSALRTPHELAIQFAADAASILRECNAPATDLADCTELAETPADYEWVDEIIRDIEATLADHGYIVEWDDGYIITTDYTALAASALDHEGTEAYFGPLAERLIEVGDIDRRELIGILADELANAQIYIPINTSVTIPDAVVTACTAGLTERYPA